MENVRKKIILTFIYMDFFLTVVFTAISHMFMVCSNLRKAEGIKNVYVHCFLDGRDTAPTSGKGFIEALEAKMAELGVGKIASISGRYYAMDR